MIPIRALHPNLDHLATDDSSKAFVASVRENVKDTFYYLYNKFNLTEVQMNCSSIDIRQSNGKEVLKLINDDIADTSYFKFVPSYLPKNVSASGILVDHYQCNLITFPETHTRTENPTVKDFLEISFTGYHVLVFSLFLIFNNILWYWREDISLYRVHWEILRLQNRQRFIPPKTYAVRLSIASFVIGLTIIQAIIVAFIDTNRISVINFVKVQTIQDIYDHKLLPLIGSLSSCTKSIHSQPLHIHQYLNRKNLIKENETYSTVEDMLSLSLITNKNLNQIVTLQSSTSWTNFLYKTCTVHPKSLMDNPAYISRIPIEIQLQPILMRKGFTWYGRKRLKMNAATLTEQGLLGKSKAIKKLARAANPICMHSRLQKKRKKYTVIEYTYFQPLLMLLMIVSAIATVVFLIENTNFHLF